MAFARYQFRSIVSAAWSYAIHLGQHVAAPRVSLLRVHAASVREGEQRPQLTAALTGAELQRWYWLATELAGLARELGVSPSGSKLELTARVAAALDDGTGAVSPRRASRRVLGEREQLSGELSLDSVIPAGQRCSQELRRFFVAQVGPAFRFDGPMREFIAGGDGRTLGEAVEHWRATRNRPPGDIAPQFELNRFVRDWHAANPGGKHEEALAAWRLHRSRPVDARAVDDSTAASGDSF